MVPTRFSVACCLTLSVMVLSACSSLPYIGNPRPDLLEGMTRKVDTSLTRGSMAYSIVYADNTYDAYQAKLVEEFQRQQVLSSGLLTLGTLAVGATAFKAHRDVLISAALGGGLAYQLGTWNSNRDRLGIYIEGMKAMSCAKAAIAPLRISSLQLSRIHDHANLTSNALDLTAGSVADVTRWLALVGADKDAPSELAKAARAQLTEVVSTFSQASDLLGRAAGTTNRVEGAGALLENKIEEVRRLIDAAINGTLADLNNLPKVIGGIAEYANLFAPGLKLDVALSNGVGAANTVLANLNKPDGGLQSISETGVMQTAVPSAELAKALGQLRGRAVMLSARMAALNGALDSGTLSQVQNSIAGCGADTAKLASVLKIDRNTVPLQAGVAATPIVNVSGGTSPYFASLLDTPHKGIDVAVLAGSGQVRVVATTESEAGTYQVRVADSASLTTSFAIKVEAKPAAPASAEKPPTNKVVSTATCAGFNNRSRTLICLVQKQVGATIDGQYGPNTCRAFRSSVYGKSGLLNDPSLAEIVKSAGLPVNPSDEAISKAFTKEEQASCDKNGPLIKGMPATSDTQTPAVATKPVEEAKGARTAIERSASAAQIGDWRELLSLPRTPPAFDDAFRDALSKFQVAQNLPEKKGELDAATATALEKKGLGKK